MDKRTSWVEWVLIIAIVVIAVVSVVSDRRPYPLWAKYRTDIQQDVNNSM